MIPRRLLALHLVALGAGIAALVVLVYPFWPWILLGLWIAGLATPLTEPVVRFVHGRRRAAAMITLGLCLAVLLPLTLVLVPLVLDALSFARKLVESADVRRALVSLASNGSPATEPQLSLEALAGFVDGRGARTLDVFRSIAGATTHALIGFVVLVLVAYERLAQGAIAYGWLEQHLPVDRRHLARVTQAFAETGRGLFVGIGGAGLAQAVVSTALYVAIGVPHAILLGVLTLFSALIPGIGAGLVWLPVACALVLTGNTASAAIVAVVGLAIISTIDNILRPWLTRYGKLDLPASVVFVAVLGGLLVAGAPGLLVGPLVVRLAKELVVIAREERSADARSR